MNQMKVKYLGFKRDFQIWKIYFILTIKIIGYILEIN